MTMDRMRAPAFRLPQSRHGVQRLAGLADDDDQIPRPHDGVAVPEFGGETHLHRAAEHPLQIVLAHHAHMVAGAAGHDADTPQLPYLPVGHGQVAEHHPSLLDTAGDGAGNGVRLLADLLEHKVIVAALFRGVHVPVDVVMLLLRRAAALVIDADAAGGDHRQLPVIHVHHVPGIGEQRRHIRGDEVLALTIAQQQRRVLPDGDEPVRCVAADDAQRVSALHYGEHIVYRLKEVAAGDVAVLQQLGHHLRIRLGAEDVALFSSRSRRTA